MSQAITINLPEPVYELVKQHAEETQRSIEDALVELVSTLNPEEEKLPAELANAVAGLGLLDDKTLWQAARSKLPAKTILRLEKLHDKRREKALKETEAQELAGLIKEYEKCILVRSEAMNLLMERGYDISKLVKAKKG